MPNKEDPCVEAAEARHVHFRGATGAAVRTEFWNGREHLVVPCVALQEGVIHAINASVPEFVPATSLAKNCERWQGHPLVVGHPVKNGRQISAHDPIVLEQHGFGIVRRSFMKDNRLGVEALVDPQRLIALGHLQLLEDLRAGKPIEVSVGAFVTTQNKSGEYLGKPYKAEWLDITPDHLAFLPHGVGACSVSAGCGANRACEQIDDTELAIPTFSSEEIEALGGPGSGHHGHSGRKGGGSSSDGSGGGNVDIGSALVSGVSSKTYPGLKESREAIDAAVSDLEKAGFKEKNPHATSPVEIYGPDGGRIHFAGPKNREATITRIPGKDGDRVVVSASKLRDAASKQDCPACHGSGNTGENPCDVCDGTGEINKEVRTMAEKDIAATEKTPEQTEADRILADKAAAGDAAFKAACSKESKMNAEHKTELIRALVTDKFSGFTAGDEKMLESASDERLESFRVAAEARKNETADLKAAANKQFTSEEFMKVAPPELKALIDRQQKQECELKTELVTQLKAAQSEYSEAELSVMSTADLTRMARLAKVDAPKFDYSGRALPRQLAKAEEDFTPPNPYDEGLKALRAKTH